MPFTQQQRDNLDGPLSRGVVKTRQQGGGGVSYVEGWHVIAEANRIFGYDRWSSSTLDVHCVAERERLVGKQQAPGWGVTYTARVRITVDTGDDGVVSRDGCGAGHGIDLDLGQAHESALKEAETDARKRALMTFGNPFGLALYDKQQTNVVDEIEFSRQRFIEQVKANIEELGSDPDGLLRWWNSDGQRAARRDFDLTPAEVIILKNLVTAKVPKKTDTL
jgi:DNA recombination protein Rad52